ncbi:hypothetical protein TNCV_2250161 [Trichonephila clavipes]|nr:hypothetical protein TNCV_2250161 [Trichonephila clavipes]
MLSDKCTWSWGHCLLFDLGQAPTPRLAVIMVKREPAPIDNKPGDRERLLWPANEKGRGACSGPALVFKKGFFRRREKSPGWRELEDSVKEKNLDQDWSGKEGETMNAGGVGELE